MSDSEPGEQAANIGDELPDHLKQFSVGSVDDALISNETERIYLVDEENQRYWWFDIAEISWYKKNSIFAECIEQTGAGEGRMDAAKYYREVAKEMIQEWSGSDEMDIDTFLVGLSDDLGSQLEQKLPDPGSAAMDVDEQGNSDVLSDQKSRITGK